MMKSGATETAFRFLNPKLLQNLHVIFEEKFLHDFPVFFFFYIF